MKKLRTMLIGFCVFGYGIATQAQEAVSAAGGNTFGSGGTASYTVGQVAYTTNSSASGTITQGVQQPYEILVATGVAEAKGISLECIVYPNPTNDLQEFLGEGAESTISPLLTPVVDEFKSFGLIVVPGNQDRVTPDRVLPSLIGHRHVAISSVQTECMNDGKTSTPIMTE